MTFDYQFNSYPSLTRWEKVKSYFKKNLKPYYKRYTLINLIESTDIALESRIVIFGWQWKSWKYISLTGKVFQLSKDQETPILEPSKDPQRLAIYSAEDFKPYYYDFVGISKTGLQQNSFLPLF